MSKIGRFTFSHSCELHVVSAFGDSVPINDACEVELEVECILYCDDSEEGVFAENITATIEGTEIELGEAAIELLNLSCVAGEIFMDNGVIYPEKGTKYVDINGRTWTIVGSGRHSEVARDYTLLESHVGFNSIRRDPYRRMVVETAVLVHPVMIDVEGGKIIPIFRRAIEDDEPGPGEFRASYWDGKSNTATSETAPK